VTSAFAISLHHQFKSYEENHQNEPLPHQQTMRGCLDTAAQQADQRRHGGREDETVEAIHQAAVTRDQVA
jgi:hypothetical protein